MTIRPLLCGFLLSAVLVVGGSLPLFAESNYGQYWGGEMEATLVQPMVIVENDGYSTHQFPGSYKLETVNLGLSAGWEFRTWWHPMWLGLRGRSGSLAWMGWSSPSPGSTSPPGGT